jgi:hypothetical protein
VLDTTSDQLVIEHLHRVLRVLLMTIRRGSGDDAEVVKFLTEIVPNATNLTDLIKLCSHSLVLELVRFTSAWVH